MILSVENLWKTHPPRSGPLSSERPEPTLRGVSLTMRPGEIRGVVGPSGCGKTTLARILALLDTPDGGTMTLGAAPVANASGRALRRLRAQVQMVFQDPYGSLNPRHRIARIVAEPLHLLERRPGRAEREAMVRAALEAVGLDAGALSRFPHEFSGGQRQRIAIARATILRPPLLIADEAVSALDLSVQAQVLNLFLDLRERDNCAILFISHDLAAVGAVADRIAVMDAGLIVEEGPTARILEAPTHPVTRALLDARLD